MDQSTKPTRSVNRLKAKENFILATFVLAEYAKRALSDKEFAAVASEALGIPHLTEHNIAGARLVNDIPSTREVNAGGDERKLAARLDALARESERTDVALSALAAEVERLRVTQQVLVSFAQQSAAGSGLKFHLGALK